jgi:PAS domain S-box-containing protein
MTSAKNQNEALEKSLARAGDAVLAVDPDGRVTLWNRAAERILGWRAKEVLGRRCCDVLAGGDGHGSSLCYRDCDVMGQIRLGEPVEHFAMKTRTKAGRVVWLDVSTLEAPSANGGGPGTVHLFRDITATRKILDTVREQAASSAQVKGNAACGLTKREIEILRLIAAGANTKVLAEQLKLSPATIRNHAQNIFTKLDVHSRLEAVAWANRHGLVQAGP